jgi:hypothetical protein
MVEALARNVMWEDEKLHLTKHQFYTVAYTLRIVSMCS